MDLATALSLLAIFLVSAWLVGSDDALPADPRDRLPPWARFGLR
jgi:hypothetical protein